MDFNIENTKLIADLKSADFTTRWFAAEVLGTKRDLTNGQIKEIIKIIPKSDVAEVLCWGLGQMKYKNAVNIIASYLENKNLYYRWRAAEALRDIGNDEARLALERYLDKSKDAETRWRCAWAIGEIGSIKSFPILWKHVSDSDRYVKWKSVWGISILKGDVEKLIKREITKTKNNPYLMWRAIWILGRVGNNQTITWIKQFLEKEAVDNKYIHGQANIAINTIKKNDK